MEVDDNGGDIGDVSITALKEQNITSPSQLQEVTLDSNASFAYSVGARSPGGPMRGLSVKEFEEQLTTLKKENFNLKLRIYFLEERMGTNLNLDQGDAVKQNIELMVELESLRKELQEKQDLLCQAVKAMELEEEEHRKDTMNKERQLCDMKFQYEQLQQQYEVVQEDARSQSDHISVDDQRDFYTNDLNVEQDTQEIIKGLEGKIFDLEERLRCEQITVQQLNERINESKQLDNKEQECQMNRLCAELENKISENHELSLKLRNFVDKFQDQQNEILYKDREIANNKTQIADLENELSNLSNLYQEAKTSLEQELKKNEKSKTVVTHRNQKIADMELLLDKLKAKNTSLQLKLESAQNEVKSKTQDSQASKSPRRTTTNTDSDSFAVRGASATPEHTPLSISRLSSSNRTPNSSPNRLGTEENALILYNGDLNASYEQVQQDLAHSKKRIQKLEQDQLKAVHIIQSMIENRKKSDRERSELQNTIQEFENEIMELRKKYGVPEKEKKSLQSKISELNLTAAAPASDAEKTQAEEDFANEQLQQYKTLVDDLDAQKEILLNTLHEKDKKIKVLQERYEEIVGEMKLRDNRIIDLEFEILSLREDESTLNAEKSDGGDEKVSYWKHDSDEKSRQIERLEKELNKKTCDLQALVNNELWEKNREIEKMQKRLNFVVEKKDAEIDELKRDIINKENQLKVLKDRINEVQLHPKDSSSIALQCDDKIAHDKLKHSVQERKKLILESAQLKEKMLEMASNERRHREEMNCELRKSEKLRIESNEICAVLSQRLEELAHFLDSLLKMKSVLGFLGHKQNNKLRTIIDHSLELSQCLNLTMSMNLDQSLLQLSNISNLLDTTRNESLHIEEFFPDDNSLSIMADNITLTYQSHLNVRNTSDKLHEQSEVIKVLRLQIDNLKHEIELRDRELATTKTVNNDDEFVDIIMQLNPASPNAFTTPKKMAKNLLQEHDTNSSHDKIPLKSSAAMKNIENLSDSESWSEPDRSVSKARIGLNNQSLSPKIKITSESTEMESKMKSPTKKAIAENRYTINTLMQQVDLLEDKLKFQNEKIQSYLELERLYQEEKVKHHDEHSKLMEEKRKYQEAVAIHEELMKQIQLKLAASELKLQESENQVLVLRSTIAELQSSKDALIDNIDSKQKAVQNKLNELESEKTQAEQAAHKAEEQWQISKNEVEILKMELWEIQKKLPDLEDEIYRKAEADFSVKLRQVQLDYELQVHKMEVESELQIQDISKKAIDLQLQYDSEYVKKIEMERLLTTLRELESLQDVLKISEQKVKSLQETETCLKMKLENMECNYNEKIQELHEELDRATLLESEKLLEFTKLAEEKSELEAYVNAFKDKEDGFGKQVDDLKLDFELMKEKFQKQATKFEAQRVKLQLKISELETTNAELLNKCIRLQTGKEMDQPFSTPTSPNSRILEMYLSKNRYLVHNSDKTGSYGLDSQMCLLSKNSSGGEENSSLTPEQDRASPDLGIESDQGRFSSLEGVNSTRPYLQPLEISHTMNNMLEKDKLCGDLCCKKVATENTHLKGKLKHYNKLLQETYVKLSVANQRKREVEKNISKEIHKTSQVLRKAKVNLETSNSDTELVRK